MHSVPSAGSPRRRVAATERGVKRKATAGVKLGAVARAVVRRVHDPRRDAHHRRRDDPSCGCPRSSCAPTARRTRSSSASTPTRASAATARRTRRRPWRGVHRHAGLALDARRHARDAARPRPVRHRADLARPLRDDRARRHARGRHPHDLGDRHRAARPRRAARSGSPSTACSAAASAIASASTRARSCPRRPTRCAGT